MNFEWDSKKAAKNQKTHGVSFEEATIVFEDEYGLEEYDDSHSTFDEKRFNRIGQSEDRILYVVYTVLNEGTDEESYRIISAKDAEKWEVEIYEKEKLAS